MQVLSDRIIWSGDDWLKSLNPQYYSQSVYTGRYPGYGLMTANPFYALGSIAPPFFAKDIDIEEDIDSVQRSGKVYRGAVISTCYGNQLVRTDILSNISVPVLTVGTVEGVAWPYAINSGSADTEGDDTATYSSNVGGTLKRNIFYSWRDDGVSPTWNVGMYNGEDGTIDDDFMSTVPANAAAFDDTNYDIEHPIYLSSDDVLYMGDGNKLHAYDGRVGSNGTFYEEVFTIQNGMVITAMADYQTFLVIFAYDAEQSTETYMQGRCKAYIWDKVNRDAVMICELNDNYVSEALPYNGTVICFTEGRTSDLARPVRDSSLQIFDGSKFVILASWTGDVPIRGGAFVQGESIYFNARNRFGTSSIFCYGSPFANTELRLYELHSVGSGGFPGILMQPAKFYLYCSGGTNNAAYLDNTKFGSGLIVPQSASPIAPDGQVNKFTYLKIRFARTTSGTDITRLRININNESNRVITAINNEAIAVTAQNIVLQLNADRFPAMYFSAINLLVQWTNTDSTDGDDDMQLIDSIELGYEPVNINNLYSSS